MAWADYHVHSRHSFDSEAPIAHIVQCAMEKGVDTLCLTDHIEPHHPRPDCDLPPDYPAWIREIEHTRAQFPTFTLLMGLEIGDNAPYRQEIYQTLDALPLDFRLLSLHLVDDVDPYDAAFFEGRTQQAAYRRYVEAKLESVLHFENWDALAHLGYCGKFAPYPPNQRPLRWHHAPDHLDMLLRHMALAGKALEINTSGFKQTDCPIPGPDILRRFAQLGGEFVTLGSDAHKPEDVAFRFEEGRQAALQAGLRWGVRYQNRRAEPYLLERS